MGNLDRMPTSGLTGSTGPAMLLRGIFAELNKNGKTRPLNLSGRRAPEEICGDPGPVRTPDGNCRNSAERFRKPAPSEEKRARGVAPAIRLTQPTEGLHLAMDPRVPDDREAFEFRIEGLRDGDSVEWVVDNVSAGRTAGGKYLWSLKKGKRSVRAIVLRDQKPFYEIGETQFLVK